MTLTLLVRLSLALTATVCLLVCVLSAVYVWSGNTARRTRAWRVLRPSSRRSAAASELSHQSRLFVRSQ
ncbi:hypothetical protein DVA86_14055 [Streptomyces armeniacus]|uniref:Uncharacterized protein n=1 Tax=Streptomyces armeniacus TaxID=83291 RepID=A0A345XPP3_9ACTN|nr:hypothetical protein DVA86_14055 [Streptomyces armeniacus]